MKSMRAPSVAIFFMTYFHRRGGVHGPLAPPGSATVVITKFPNYSISLVTCIYVDLFGRNQYKITELMTLPMTDGTKQYQTRMHSSRMRTARSLTVSHCIQKNWKNHAQPPHWIKPRMPPCWIKPRMPPRWIKPCMPPLNKTTHAPRIKPHMPPE